jgi:hypothetical protein
MLSAFIVLGALLAAGDATGLERTAPKRAIGAGAVVQTQSAAPVASRRGVRSGPAASAESRFRAEDIVPDICNGCAS